jgi:hypothetical protein
MVSMSWWWAWVRKAHNLASHFLDKILPPLVMVMTAKTTETTSLLCPSFTITNSCRSWLKWSLLSIATGTIHHSSSRIRPFAAAITSTSTKVGSGHYKQIWSCALPAGLRMDCLSNLMSFFFKRSCRMWQERRYEEHSEWTNFSWCPTCLCHCRSFTGRSAYDNKSLYNR